MPWSIRLSTCKNWRFYKCKCRLKSQKSKHWALLGRIGDIVSTSSLPSCLLLIEVTLFGRALPVVTFPGFSRSISTTAMEHCSLFILIGLSPRQRMRSSMLWDVLFTKALFLCLIDSVLWFSEKAFLDSPFLNFTKQFPTESKIFFNIKARS